MRAVFVGAGSLTVNTARVLLKRGHDVVLVERDRDTIDDLEDELDCGFIHGDGSRPMILREADPEGSDVLFCLTGDDQTNIIAGLVGRSLGFERVVTKIENPEFEHVCIADRGYSSRRPVRGPRPAGILDDGSRRRSRTGFRRRR